MLGRTALFTSAATAAAVAVVPRGQHYSDGMFVLPLLGIHLMLSLVTYYTPGLGACGHYNSGRFSHNVTGDRELNIRSIS